MSVAEPTLVEEEGKERRLRRWPGVTMILAGVGAFVAVALDIEMNGQLKRWDEPLHHWIFVHAQPWLVLVCSIFSGAGEFKILLPLGVGVGLWLLWRKQYWATGVWAIALLGSLVINTVLKEAFGVPRPDHELFYVFKPNSGFSFPSGHAQGATITMGTLVLLGQRLGWWRASRNWMMWMLAVVLSLVVGFSLLYVGVHMLTDVLAGLGVGLAWVGVCVLLSAIWPLTGRP